MRAVASRHLCSLLSFFLLTTIAAAKTTSAQERDAISVERVGKRADTNATKIPAAINIPPSQYWDGNDGPWSSFGLQVGSPAQNIRVMASTAGFATWTINQDKGCPNITQGFGLDCATSRGFLFYSNKSLTYIENSIFETALETNLNLDSTADFGFDTVTLALQGQNGPTVPHSVIGRVADFNYWIGIFGLNPRPSNFTTFNAPQPSFMGSLRNGNESQIPSLSWAYTAGNQYRFNHVFGSLVLGGYDAARFDASKAVSFPFYPDIGRDLVVSVSSITHSESGSLSSTAFPAFIDSTVPHLWLPKDVCQAFEKAFGLTYDEDYGLYLVNSSLHTQLLRQNASVTLTLAAPNGTVAITLPYSAFDLQVSWPIVVDYQFTASDKPSNTSYYFPLKRADNSTQYTLGRTFLQEAYLIADYERSNFTLAPCVWDDAIQNNVIDVRSILSPDYDLLKKPSGGFGTGAIVGVVVGIVAVIAILCAILWFLRRKKKQRKSRAKLAELEATEAAAREREKSASADESKPFISAPMGGELSGSEIHEMAGPYGSPAAEMDSPYRIDPNKVGYSEVEGSRPTEYFGKNGRVGAQEVQGDAPIYEMPGSDVYEMSGEGIRRGSVKPASTNSGRGSTRR